MIKYNEKLVEKAIYVAEQASWKYAGRQNYDLYEEYLTIANIGATKALQTFDPSKGYEFSTYCGVCVLNELRMESRRKDQLQYYYLEEELFDNSELNGYNRLVDKEENVEEEAMYNILLDSLFNDIDEILNPKEKSVFEILYNHPEYTCKKIGEILGHSGSYISRLEIRVKKAIKAYIREKGYDHVA